MQKRGKSCIFGLLVVLELLVFCITTNAQTPMADLDFQKLIGTIQRSYFSSNRLPLVEQAALERTAMSTEQILRILEIFTHEGDRLKVLQLLWPNVVDPENKRRIYRAFFFPSNKTKAQDLMKQIEASPQGQ